MDDEGDEDSSKDEEEDVYQPDSEPEEPGMKMTVFSLSEAFGFSIAILIIITELRFQILITWKYTQTGYFHWTFNWMNKSRNQ